MNQKIKMMLSLFATMILAFLGIFFSIKGTNSVSIIKNEKMPFMGNTYVSYGGFDEFTVTDITNTSEASEIKSSYDEICEENDCEDGFDFNTMLKVRVNITQTTEELSDILFVNVDDGLNIGSDISYYFDYYDASHDDHSYGIDLGDEELFIRYGAGDSITLYIMPMRDVKVGNTRLAFVFDSFSSNPDDDIVEVLNSASAYVDFALYKIRYGSSLSSDEYIRVLTSYLDGFTIDNVTQLCNNDFKGWAIGDPAHNVGVLHQKSYSGVTIFDELFKTANNYEVYLFAKYQTAGVYRVVFNKGNRVARLDGSTGEIDNYATYSITDS